ncbi:hypothetical protein [Anabaena lutea]|uniref:hypothetical protein n=1 Tax=Anabaena lutea TaxID=212350 RepID=UPI001F558989|nr:hypothetical protein [Anabaena lutea]
MLGLLEKFSRWEELTSQSALDNVDSVQILLMNGINWNIMRRCYSNLKILLIIGLNI